MIHKYLVKRVAELSACCKQNSYSLYFTSHAKGFLDIKEIPLSFLILLALEGLVSYKLVFSKKIVYTYVVMNDLDISESKHNAGTRGMFGQVNML